jgi:hypothetical protein
LDASMRSAPEGLRFVAVPIHRCGPLVRERLLCRHFMKRLRDVHKQIAGTLQT